MLNKGSESIQIHEPHQKITDIRETFQQDNLPDDFANPININENDLPEYETLIFIQ
ncbi:MAG: hypothetical protein LBH06_05605 [Rikenellaceae bacterium]|jgi:hypothetical protein|nr:hypothetical protein [Rikenellaceae bacterium]